MRRRLCSGSASGGGLLLRRLFLDLLGCGTILSLLILELDVWFGLKKMRRRKRRGGGFVHGGGGGSVMMVMVQGGGNRVVLPVMP